MNLGTHRLRPTHLSQTNTPTPVHPGIPCVSWRWPRADRYAGCRAARGNGPLGRLPISGARSCLSWGRAWPPCHARPPFPVGLFWGFLSSENHSLSYLPPTRTPNFRKLFGQNCHPRERHINPFGGKPFCDLAKWQSDRRCLERGVWSRKDHTHSKHRHRRCMEMAWRPLVSMHRQWGGLFKPHPQREWGTPPQDRAAPGGTAWSSRWGSTPGLGTHR